MPRGRPRQTLVVALVVGLAIALALVQVARPAPAASPAPHVLAFPSDATAILENCRKADDPWACGMHALDHAMAAGGLEGALKIVERMAALSAAIRASAHELTHELGRLSLSRFPEPGARCERPVELTAFTSQGGAER